MGLFIKMEEAFAGTAFYQTYVVRWPPPFNIASFDVCLILFILLSFICPIIRDVIVSRLRAKREYRWYQEYQRKKALKEGAEAEDDEIKERIPDRRGRIRRRKTGGPKKAERILRRKKTNRHGSRKEETERIGGARWEEEGKERELEILDEDYFFDEEDVPEVLGPLDGTEPVGSNVEQNDHTEDFRGGIYDAVYGNDADMGNTDIEDTDIVPQHGRQNVESDAGVSDHPETIDARDETIFQDVPASAADYMRMEQEALTEMDFADEVESQELFRDEESNLTTHLPTEASLPNTETMDIISPQPEDEYSRLMRRIRRTREEKESARLFEQSQEANRLRNLDEIDRHLSEKMRRSESAAGNQEATENIALERAKQAALSEKRAEMEKRWQREEKLHRQTGKGKRQAERKDGRMSSGARRDGGYQAEISDSQKNVGKRQGVTGRRADQYG